MVSVVKGIANQLGLRKKGSGKKKKFDAAKAAAPSQPPLPRPASEYPACSKACGGTLPSAPVFSNVLDEFTTSQVRERRATAHGNQPIMPKIRQERSPDTLLALAMKGPQKGDIVCFCDKKGKMQRGEVFRRVEQRVRVVTEMGTPTWTAVKELKPLSDYVKFLETEAAHVALCHLHLNLMKSFLPKAEIEVEQVEVEVTLGEGTLLHEDAGEDEVRAVERLATELGEDLDEEQAQEEAAVSAGLEWGEATEVAEALPEPTICTAPIAEDPEVLARVLARLTVAGIDESEGGTFALDVDESGVLARGRLSPRSLVCHRALTGAPAQAATSAVLYPATNVPANNNPNHPYMNWTLPHDGVVPLLFHGGESSSLPFATATSAHLSRHAPWHALRDTTCPRARICLLEQGRSASGAARLPASA